MAAPRSTDGNLDELPRALRVALGVSRDWMRQAACTGQTGERYYAWRVKPKDEVNFNGSRYRGSKLIAYALEVCSTCPVQWACAAFAVETEAATGTWGTTFDDIRYLQKMKERGEPWRGLLDEAEAADVPVQVALRVARGKVLT